MSDYHLIIPINLKSQPDEYEKVVARLCAEKFRSDVLFVKRGIATTPDIYIMRTRQNLRHVILITKDRKLIDFEL